MLSAMRSRAGAPPTPLVHILMPMAPFIFTCPNTDLNVQHWLDDDNAVQENEYVGITCSACTGLHFINRKTRKLFGQNDE
jgi:hypothetical protein